MKLFLLFAAAILIQGQTNLECSISGRLSNILTGLPVRKALVTLVSPAPDRFSRSVFSDAEGRYTLTGIPPGRYHLSVQRAGFLPLNYGAKSANRPGKVLALSPGEKLADLNLTMQQPAVISGRVTDEDGEPVPHVAVQALNRDLSPGGGEYFTVGNAFTNDLGEYRLFSLPSGSFYIMVSQSLPMTSVQLHAEVYASAFYPGTSDFGSAAPIKVSAGGEARDIDIRVSKNPAVAVRGSITNVPPGSERTLQIQMFRKDRARLNFAGRSSGGYNATTGQFEFQALTPGTYTVSAWIQDKDVFIWAQQDVEVGGVDLNDLRLTLGPAIQIPGKVVLNPPRPGASGWHIRLSGTMFSGPRPTASSGPDGSFLLKLIPGKVWAVDLSPIPPNGYVQAVRLGEEDGLVHPLAIDAASKGSLTIVVGLDGGTLSGTVRTPGGDKPLTVEGATVLLVPAHEYWTTPGYFKTAVTEADGRYEIKGIPPGSYHLLALDDMEPFGYLRPEFQSRLENKGAPLVIAPNAKMDRELTIEPLP